MLSRRAREQIPLNAYNLMWEVVKDLWDAQDNPQGLLNLGVAENRLMHTEMEEYISRDIDLRGSVLTYQDGPTGSLRLRTALARFLNSQLRPHKPLDASQILVTNGVSSALEHSSWALANSGDAFLLGRPYYGAINLTLRPEVRTLPVTFGDIDPLSLAAVKCYEAAILAARQQGTAVKGLLLCSPHNPLGQCYSRDVLMGYLSLCSKYRIHLVSDEVYALSVWREPSFTSVLSLNLEEVIDPSLVHVLWGVSKDFGINGWRLGCIISPSNKSFHAALGTVAIYSYVSSITDHIMAQMLEDAVFTTAYLIESRRRLESTYTFTTDFLRQHAIPYAPANAGFFLWVDLGQAYLNRYPGRTTLREAADEVKHALWARKVYLAYGEQFNSESPGMFRIVFAHPRDYLEEAFRRIHQALEDGIRAGQSLTIQRL